MKFQYNEYLFSNVHTAGLVLEDITSHSAEYSALLFQLFMGLKKVATDERSLADIY